MAGCLTEKDADDEAQPESPSYPVDPQRASHPAFGWPTAGHLPADAPAWWQPIPAVAMPDAVQRLVHEGGVGAASAGDGIFVFGRLAIAPGDIITDTEAAAEIYDLSSPKEPTLLSEIDLEFPARQVDGLAYPDGRLVAAFVSGNGYILLVDATDPTDPRQLSIIDLPTGGHTAWVVPGTPILYNANTVGASGVPLHEAFGGTSTPQTEIYDLTDPEEPVLLEEWKNGYGCHAISFHITAERQRAYCAGVEGVQIWDIADPRHPFVVTSFSMPHAEEGAPAFPPLATVAHWPVVNADASILAIADETGGGLAQACDVHAETEGQSVSGPLGNVWFYDISVETEPVMLSWISPSVPLADNPPPHTLTPVGSCTAHMGRMVPDPHRALLAMTFYSAGVVLIDFTDPTVPRIVDQWADGQPSDVWFASGYLISGDIDGGIDVFTFA